MIHRDSGIRLSTMADWQKLDSADARHHREAMVDSQLVPRGIRDAAVLEAFRTVPRHVFCPEGTPLSQAYSDRPLSIGEGQTISQPFIVALMTSYLGLTGCERVLEIGGGSGYQAAILACLCAEVHSVERVPALVAKAREKLAALGIDNVHLHEGDGTLGWPEQAPYEAEIVTAAAPDIPPPLKDQLAANGRLVIPAGSRRIQELRIVTRRGDRFDTKGGESCCFVPLLGEHGWHTD